MVEKKKVAVAQRMNLYDTSICHAKFRRPRILQNRERSFDANRKLNFDPNRKIDARLTGVVFRTVTAVGFRNLGLSNLDDVKDMKDWPEVGKARPPETMSIKRHENWERTWGKDTSHEQRWGPASQMRGGAHPIKERMKQVATEIMEGPALERIPSSYPQMSAQTTVVREYAPQTSEKDRKKAFAFNEYALALMEMEDYGRAMSYFEKALDLDPGEQIYRTNLERCQQWLEHKRKGGGNR